MVRQTWKMKTEDPLNSHSTVLFRQTRLVRNNKISRRKFSPTPPPNEMSSLVSSLDNILHLHPTPIRDNLVSRLKLVSISTLEVWNVSQSLREMFVS